MRTNRSRTRRAQVAEPARGRLREERGQAGGADGEPHADAPGPERAFRVAGKNRQYYADREEEEQRRRGDEEERGRQHPVP